MVRLCFHHLKYHLVSWLESLGLFGFARHKQQKMLPQLSPLQAKPHARFLTFSFTYPIDDTALF